MITKLEQISNADLVKVFNAVTGKAVRKFTNGEIGRERTYKALKAFDTSLEDALVAAGLRKAPEAPVEVVQPLVETEAEKHVDRYGFVHRRQPATKGPAKPSKLAKAIKAAKATAAPAAEPAEPKAVKVPRGKRMEEVLALLRRPGGATVAEIMEVTGWLPHTTRAYLSRGGAPAKAGVAITGEKTERDDGAKVMVYRA